MTRTYDALRHAGLTLMPLRGHSKLPRDKGWMSKAFRPVEGFKYIGVGPTKRYAMLKSGELRPLIAVSGRVRVFLQDDLDDFLDRQRARPNHGSVGEAANG